MNDTELIDFVEKEKITVRPTWMGYHILQENNLLVQFIDKKDPGNLRKALVIAMGRIPPENEDR